MANFTSVVIVGRLTRDPQLRYAPSGSPVCSLSVATSRRFTREDGQKTEATTFIDVDVWKRLAEICAQFLKKGREVLITGSLRQSRWKDPKTQEPRSRLRVVAQQVQFLGPKPAAVDEPPAAVPEADETVKEEEILEAPEPRSGGGDEPRAGQP